MEIRQTSLSFAHQRGVGPRIQQVDLAFVRPVRSAVASLVGYSLGFEKKKGDRHLGRMHAQLETAISGKVVTVKGLLGLRDKSSNWDDSYGGTLQAAVIAELVPASAPAPHPGLRITGVEVNQATQSFRSHQHLQGPVLPDNAIPLIAGKRAGVRVYVDYNLNTFAAAPLNLKPIALLSGEMEVLTGSHKETLTPYNPIAPRRDDQILRTAVGNTLNFAIPAPLCRGSVELRIRVFDQADPSNASGDYVHTFQFVEVNPMRIIAVGVRHTFLNPTPPAATAAMVSDAFDMARTIFPLSEITLSGYETMDFGEDINTTDTTGCGDGFESLRKKLKKLRGDSDDLVYGLLPAASHTAGNFVGCGGEGAGAGVDGSDSQETAAHEAGHAYGRKHAPCDDAGRCDKPDKPDDDYPSYAPFVSDSIGEVGLDVSSATACVVHLPGSTGDIMGYSWPKWISPYTYLKMMAIGDPPGPGGASSSNHALLGPARPTRRKGEASGLPFPLLQLELTIAADRTVDIPHCFTFPARRRIRGRTTSAFRVETRDAAGAARAREPLLHDCLHCGAEGWPKRLIAEVPIDPRRTRTLVVLEDERVIAEVPLGPPPRLRLDPVVERADGRAILSWTTKDARAPATYLAHWQDELGVWRGVGLVQRGDSFIVPARLRFTRDVPVRILASNGLVTTTASVVLKRLARRPKGSHGPRVRILVSQRDGQLPRATAYDELDRTLPGADFVWFDARGAEIARGDTLDTWQVPPGAHRVRVVSLNAGAGKAECEIEVVGRKLAPSPRRPTPPRPPAPKPARPKVTPSKKARTKKRAKGTRS